MREDQGAAIAAIYNAQGLYNIAIDNAEFDKVAMAFAQDGVMSPSSGAVWTGRKEIGGALAKRREARRPFETEGTFQRHNLTTRLVEFTSDTTATGVCYYVILTELGVDHCGCYFDNYGKYENDWFITHRQSKLDWMLPNSRFIQYFTKKPQ